VVLVAGALVAAGAVYYWPASDPSLRRVQQMKELRVGYAVEAPFAFVDPQAQVTGVFPEAAQVIGKQLGVTHIVWVQTAFASLIPDLLEGRYDVIASGYMKTPERASLVEFSDPLLRINPGVLVAKGNPHRLAPYAGLAPLPGIRIAVINGSTAQRMLIARGFTPEALLVVPDTLTGSSAVLTGVAQGFVSSLPAVIRLQARNPDAEDILQSAVPTSQAEGGGLVGFAFRPADAALLKAWNAAQAKFMAGPAHRALAARYGFGEADLLAPAPVGAAGGGR
jgi:polar amino acid transport system substrate-binding protein